METPDLSQLSRREREIMDLIFQHRTMTAQEVQDGMEDPPSYATVRSLLRILEEKGHVTHSKLGRQFVYSAAAETEKVKYQRLKHLLRIFFGGSISEAVATFIQDPENKLQAEELEELDKLIQIAKKNDKL